MVDDVRTSLEEKRLLQVLVVDDNRDAADSLALLLKLWGYQVRVAYNGAAGLAAAIAHLPDCLVLDIQMPQLDGYTLAKRVRQQPGLEKVKLIALSAFGDEEHVRRTKEAGFDFQLVKPADLSDLERILKMLNEVLKLATQTEKMARQNVALAGEAKELLNEVKQDIKEVKEEVKELKEDLQEVKEAAKKPPSEPEA
jgi:two-component system OmpR family response regulator